MRLWHYELLDCLDDFHIIAQYRELLAIKGAIDKNGTPNHRLVNKVMDYPIDEFKSYAGLNLLEMNNRNLNYSDKKRQEIADWKCDVFADKRNIDNGFLWHDDRYLKQCYYNLQEKYDCGIVSADAWKRIDSKYQQLIGHKDFHYMWDKLKEILKSKSEEYKKDYENENLEAFRHWQQFSDFILKEMGKIENN